MSSYTRPHHKQLPIESVFAERFAIFAPTDFEIETLELFTPDVLSELIKRATGYNLEFINNKLYIFKNKDIGTKIELKKFLDLATYLISALGDKIFRLHDDVMAMKETLAQN